MDVLSKLALSQSSWRPLAMLTLLLVVAAFFMQPAMASGLLSPADNSPRPPTPSEIAALNLTAEERAMLNMSGAMIYPSGYVVIPVDTYNLTPEQEAALKASSPPAEPVSFWELPTWIQVSYLSGVLIAVAGSIALLPLVIRKIKNPLDNANRDQVMRYIVDNPGCTAPEVSRGQELNTGTVRYHIQQLELAGKIILKKIGKYTRLYKNSSTYSDRDMIIASHLRNETSSRLLQAVLEEPGLTNQRLSERFHLDKSTVYVHMQKMVSDGIVVSEMDGKQKRYFVCEAAKESLRKLMPLNYQCPGMMRDYENNQM